MDGKECFICLIILIAIFTPVMWVLGNNALDKIEKGDYEASYEYVTYSYDSQNIVIEYIELGETKMLHANLDEVEVKFIDCDKEKKYCIFKSTKNGFGDLVLKEITIYRQKELLQLFFCIKKRLF